MKKAVIVVGSHYAGKSDTIRKFLKPKLNMTMHEHKFNRKGKKGFILSQTLEEADKTVSYVIRKYADDYDLIVLSARPANEKPSVLNELEMKLQKVGYRVSEVVLDGTKRKSYYDSKADEIIDRLDH